MLPAHPGSVVDLAACALVYGAVTGAALAGLIRDPSP
jgi:hypothetical protein